MIKSVPEIDFQAGMECYCTNFAGIKGTIKETNEEFQVAEIIDYTFLKPPYFSLAQNNEHKFPLYLLEKHNIDSNHAVIEIKKQSGLKLRIMGIKDAKAETSQYASCEQTKNLPRYIITPKTKLTLLGFLRTPLSKSALIGNSFKIKINQTSDNDIHPFLLELNKIANFYGLQRFGSERMVTHLVGKALLERNYNKAIEYLLSYTSKYDSKFSKEIREKSRDPKNYQKLIKILPKGMDLERLILYTLVKGKDSIAVIRSIPINIRRLFVQAYQSYIFNKCLSSALLCNEDIQKCKDGDLCFEIEKPLVFGKIRRFREGIDSNNDVTPAIRLVGYNYQPGKNRFDHITKRILTDENISPTAFYLKDLQELSLQMGFRQTSLCCNEFSHFGMLELSFKLPKGSYATTLLRELIKPIDPIKAGF
ncbi:MAG TPA: tRNA pseudouridine(13) synthase TruD [Nitrososphaeraceae archaeon]|nr:tRNA pseudouridine(13) synthase TruD [Nitrososphaeraceae archaeon]